MNNNQILAEAIEATYHETGLKLEVLKREYAPENTDKQADAVLEIVGKNARLVAEIRKWATNTNVTVLINQIRQLGDPRETVLVADYINPNMADKLKAAGVQFIDTVGNAYINVPPILLYIKGNKQPDTTARKPTMKTGRAFQQTGLKVLYQFLRDKELINAPYREIAKKAGVALGNIGWIMGDLLQQGYLHEGIKGKEKQWANYAGLLHKWVEEYPYKLRNKLHLGTYAGNEDIIAEFNPHEYGGMWGGEKAAADYTGYLMPKDYIIYTHPHQLRDILTHARLKKADEGKMPGVRVEIYEMFWNKKAANTLEDKTDLIITYADLLATEDPRNLETAERLREQLPG
jgi:hypothetical protein